MYYNSKSSSLTCHFIRCMHVVYTGDKININNKLGLCQINVVVAANKRPVYIQCNQNGSSEVLWIFKGSLLSLLCIEF